MIVRPLNHQEADNDWQTDRASRYLFVVTSFDQEPDRTAVPLVLANNALAVSAGWMGALAIMSEMQGRMTLSF